MQIAARLVGRAALGLTLTSAPALGQTTPASLTEAVEQDSATLLLARGMLANRAAPDSTTSRAALDFFRRAADLAARSPGRGRRAFVYIVLAGALDDTAPDSALYYARAAVRESRGLEVEAAAAAFLSNLYSSRGRSDSATAYSIASSQAQMRRLDRVNARLRTAAADTLAAAAFPMKSVEDVLTAYEHALAIARRASDVIDESRAAIGLAETYGTLGRIDSATAYARRAVTVLEESGASDDSSFEKMAALAIARGVGGSVFATTGAPDSAMAYYRRGLLAWRELGEFTGEQTALHSIGDLHLSTGSHEKALAVLRTALALKPLITDSATASDEEARLLVSLGAAHAAAGSADSAAIYLERSLAASGLGVNHSRAHWYLGYIHHRLQRPPNLRLAAEHYDSAVSLRPNKESQSRRDVLRVAADEQATGLFDLWTLALLSRGAEPGDEQSVRQALAVTELGRARVLLEFLGSASDWIVRGSEVGRLLNLGMPGFPGMPAGHVDPDSLGAVLVRNVFWPRRHFSTIVDRQDSVSTAGAVVSYLHTADTLIAWVLRPPGSVQVVRQAVREDSLAALVQALRVALGAGDRDARARLGVRGGLALETERGFGVRAPTGSAWEEATRRLASVVLPDSLLRLLPDSGEIVIVPHGSLSLVPFAALPAGPGGAILGERYAVRFAPSIAALSELEAAVEWNGPGGSSTQASRKSRIAPNALVVADPAMPVVRAADGSAVRLGQLGGALTEGTTLARRLGVPVLSQGRATESEVRRRIGQALLVHFATHGYAYASEDRARDSFIALAPDSARRGGSHDGLLTAGELLSDPSLRLSAELIVLSACQTGLGDVKHAEGTIGLQRALLARGAGAVLVSLWSVDDDATRALMERFYTHWLDDPKGVSKAEALRLAQRDVRTDASHPRWSHPRYWAAFQLVGAR